MSIALIDRATRHGAATAIADSAGAHSYDDLLHASEAVARTLLAGRADLGEARIAFMVGAGLEYAATMWGIWRAGGVAVPLAIAHPIPEIEYVLDDTGAEAIVADHANALRIRPLAKTRDAWFVASADTVEGRGSWIVGRGEQRLPDVGEARRALILFTSGTTSRPKGVVMTHRNLRAQMESLVEAWEWRERDRILHVLPLHHTHGIVNALLCALWSGAACEMLPAFDARRVWERFAAGGLTLFMAVPTIYARLIAEWDNAGAAERERWSRGVRELRLMVSGSAALPVSVFERWREITGHDLLERYGMTEIGMALSNPIDGERRPGTVGEPLPGVDVELRDENGHALAEGSSTPGEIHVRGPAVFLEYWNRHEATRAAFRDDWFRTGDVAIVDDGYYRILGRSSVDIIKTGGYKVSALEIEEALRAHPAVKDCAVVGIEDPEWGERVSAAVVPSSTTSSDSAESLKAWLADRIAPYKVPRRWLFVQELPRNAMGKVVKVNVRALFENAASRTHSTLP